MEKTHFFHLQHSESVIAEMASRIFSAYVTTNQVTADNTEDLIKKSTEIAVQMAEYTDKIVKSDGEWMKDQESLTPIKGR